MRSDVKHARWEDVAARLRPFLSRRVSPGEVDDVMQDVLLRIYRALPALRDENRFTSRAHRGGRAYAQVRAPPFGRVAT
jgi:DNA-directed RNA polymerase specialized sigma24 family protein